MRRCLVVCLVVFWGGRWMCVYFCSEEVELKQNTHTYTNVHNQPTNQKDESINRYLDVVGEHVAHGLVPQQVHVRVAGRLPVECVEAPARLLDQRAQRGQEEGAGWGGVEGAGGAGGGGGGGGVVLNDLCVCCV